jgi:hypothetical protein
VNSSARQTGPVGGGAHLQAQARADRPHRARGLSDAPLDQLPAPQISTRRKIGLTALRTYLLVAMILVVVRVVQLSLDD